MPQPVEVCSPTSCASGCCDSANVCRSPAQATCGLNGTTCRACNLAQGCVLGVCVDGAPAGTNEVRSNIDAALDTNDALKMLATG